MAVKTPRYVFLSCHLNLNYSMHESDLELVNGHILSWCLWLLSMWIMHVLFVGPTLLPLSCGKLKYHIDEPQTGASIEEDIQKMFMAIARR